MIDTAGPGGAETVFVDVVTGCRAKGHESIALIPAEDWVAETLRERGFVPEFDASMGSFDFRYLLRLVRLIKARRIDIVHAHLLTSGVYGSIAAKLCGIPSIVTFHGLTDLGRKQRLLGTKCRLLNWAASRVSFVSAELREGFLSRTQLRPHSAVVVHNGIDANVFAQSSHSGVREELGIGADEALVLSVGNIRPAKGYEVLLEAAQRTVDRGLACRFVVVGHAREPLMSSLLDKRAELGLDRVVKFIGFRSDVARLLSAADAFLLTSHSEGFSLATVQAMAAGVPVVSTRCGGPEGILQHQRSGLLVELGAVDQIADAIGQILNQPELRVRLTAEALVKVRNSFTMDSMINKYNHEYEQLSTSFPRRQPVVASAEH